MDYNAIMSASAQSAPFSLHRGCADKMDATTFGKQVTFSLHATKYERKDVLSSRSSLQVTAARSRLQSQRQSAGERELQSELGCGSRPF